MAAGFVDEVVEIVQGAVGRVDGLGVGGVGLNDREEDGVNAEGLDVVEALGDTVETAAARGAEVDGIYLVDDRVLPPDVRVDAGAGPAGAGQGLGRGTRGECAGTCQPEGEESAGGQKVWGHRASLERCYASLLWAGMECFSIAMAATWIAPIHCMVWTILPAS